MIQHAYRYVSMGAKVLASLNPEQFEEADAIGLVRAIEGIEEAESALVRAYGAWRDAITALAHAGNTEAGRVLVRTQWDLT